MAASYTQRFAVRYDECARDGTARASALLRYVIETAFGHSTREGFPLAWYDAHGLYWLVRRARLELHRPVPYGAILDVTTQVVGFRRIWARRANTIRDETAGLVAAVTVDWIFTDREGRPARIVPQMEAAFPALTGGRPDVIRLDLQEPSDLRSEPYVVPAHEVDPRGHMNNAAYLDVFEDALLARGVDPQQRPARYAIDYLRAAHPGEVLRRTAWADGRGWAMTLRTGGSTLVAMARREG